MSEFTKALLIANIYRYLLIVAGTEVAYMRYRLFALGYFEKSGELKAAFGDHHFLLKQVGPGVLFAALGMLIIATAVFRGALKRHKAANCGTSSGIHFPTSSSSVRLG